MSADMDKVVLYTYWRSSSAFRVRIALAHKKIPYASVPVNLLDGAQLDAAYRTHNPAGLVPCLVVGDRTFTESVAIIELLEELYPTPALYPDEAVSRARVRALVETINSGTQPLQNLSVLKKVGDEPAARIAWAQHFVKRGLAAFEALLDTYARDGAAGPFAFGAALGAADCFLVPQLYNARRYKLELSGYPRILAAESAALATPAVQAALPENQGDATTA
jgi:maleylacetoacetate isomerase